jgi:hypothetical protein
LRRCSGIALKASNTFSSPKLEEAATVDGERWRGSSATNSVF